MASRAFTSAKTKLLARQFGTTLGEKYKANEAEFAAARVGSSMVSIDGQLYPGAIAGDAATVTNAGRPAAAQYTAGSGGVVVVQGGGGGSVSGGSGSSSPPGTLSSTSINADAGQQTHAIDMTIARTPLLLTTITTNSNSTVGHTHSVDASSDPDLLSKILKTNTSGQVVLRELRIRDALGSSSGITHDGVGLKLQHGLRSDPDERTSYSGQAAWGYGGHVGDAIFAHRGRIDANQYALRQVGSTGATVLNSSAVILHRIGNADVMTMTASTLEMAATAAPTIKSDNYASQTTGWGITHPGAADFRYLYADQLHAKVFVADLGRALAGVEIIAKSVTLLGADFKLPYAGASTPIIVRDLPSAAGMQVFEPGDFINPPTFSRAGGSLTIGDCWGTVSSPVANGDGTQTWTFTRSGTTTYNTIVQRSSSSTVSGNGGSVIIQRPTGTVNGDFLLAYFFAVNPVLTPASNWTLLNSQAIAGGYLYVYSKFASSEPTNWTWTLSAAGWWAADAKGYTNVSTVSGVDKYRFGTNANNTAMAAGGIDPASAAGMLVFIGGVPANIRATPPSGMTEFADHGGSGASIYMANQLLANDNATGTKTATLASASTSAVCLLVLAPTYSSMTSVAGAAFPMTTLLAEKGQNAAVLDYGVSGNGYIEHNAIDGLYAVNSPYSQIVTWVTHPSNRTVRARLGNLKGLFGVTGEYGLYVGDGIGVTNKYLRLSSFTQESHNVPIRMYDGATLFMQMDTAGLRYNLQAGTATFADNTSVLFNESNGTTKVLQMVASDYFGAHAGMLKVYPGASSSNLAINVTSPSGYNAILDLSATSGTSTAGWGFYNLAGGIPATYFPRNFNVAGNFGNTHDTIDASMLVGGAIELAANVNIPQNYRAVVEIDSSTTYINSNEYYNSGWQLYDAGRAPAKITLTSASADSHIVFHTKASNTAQSTEAGRFDKGGNLSVTGTIRTTLGSTWDLGAYTAGAPAAVGYVTIKINGVTYKLLAAT